MNPRAKNWIFTQNNYTDKDEMDIENMWRKLGGEYMAYGYEEAPTTGTKHLQGWMKFTNRIYRKTIMKEFHFGYLEIARGTDEENDDYVKKGGDFKVLGTRAQTKGEKRRKGTEQLLADYMNLSQEEFEAKHLEEAFKLRRELRLWRIDHQPDEDPWDGNLKEKNFWIWGEAGTGKSKWAFQQTKGENTYSKSKNKWWDGYNYWTHKVIVLDDVQKGEEWIIPFLKTWGDRYQFQGECKGSAIKIHPARFIFIVTANHSIEGTFEGQSPEDIKAIRRRYNEIKVGQNDIFLRTNIDINTVLHNK